MLQVDAMKLLGIINIGNNRLPLNQLTRFFMFCLTHRITISEECVPREENAFADELSKLPTPDDWMLAPGFFTWLDSI